MIFSIFIMDYELNKMSKQAKWFLQSIHNDVMQILRT